MYDFPSITAVPAAKPYTTFITEVAVNFISGNGITRF